MKTLLRLLFLLIIAFCFVKAASFGWFFWKDAYEGNEKYKDSKLSERLKEHVYKLSHDIGNRSVFEPEKLDEAAAYIAKEFKSLNYYIELEKYDVFGRTATNIIAVKTGSVNPEEIIIIGAHYDTCFNPGADDNASGVAGLLELASLLSDIQIDRTVKFIAFANEEPPFFKTENMGSRVYAKSAKEKNENIKAVFILESIGYYSNKLFSQNYPPLMGLVYPSRGNFVTVVGNLPSRSLAKEVVVSFKKNTSFPIESFIGPGFIPGVDFSDNWSFWHEGYPCVMITDTAFYRNSNYHAATDTYEKLDYDAIAEVVSGLGEVVIEITKAP
ncbi:MAG TPA: M20/M25/M40 family metallo-hydrolase [Candidatus Omnitrophica bacterium]|nr:M20/M25/M40 family metallo-hydrolase [Candidatus Omnitrophota bacterium]